MIANGPITTFTPEEVAMLEMKPGDMLVGLAQQTGDPKMIAVATQFAAAFTSAHDSFIGMAAFAMSAAYEAGGPDFLSRKMKIAFAIPQKKEAESGYWSWPFKQRVEYCINHTRWGHNCKIKIVGEDDEKLTYHMDPCASGLPLIKMGVYEQGLCAKCSAHPCTAGCDSFPVYCTHAPLIEQCAVEAGIPPIYQQDYPEVMGEGPCYFTVYKDPKKIPDEYFTRIGKENPFKK